MPKHAMVIAPDLGLMDKRLDTQIVSSKLSPNMQNVRRWGNTLSQRPGRVSYGTVSGIPLEFFHFRVASLNRFICLTTTSAYYRGTSSWTDVTGSAFTGSATDFWDATMAFDSGAGTWYVVATNGVDAIKKYTGSGNFGALSGWSGTHLAKFCRYYKGYLMCAYITTGGTDYPFRIIISNTGLPEDLTGNSRTFNLVDDKNMSAIKALELFDQYAVIYKDDCIYTGYLKGDAVDIFTFDLSITDIGLRAPRAVVATPYGHFFLGWDNVYWWRSVGSQPEPIGTNTIRYELFEGQSASTLESAIATYSREDNDVRFQMPDGAVYVFSIDNASWWSESVSNVTASSTFYRDLSEAWSDQVGAWNATGNAELRWNDRDVSDNFPLTIEGLEGGEIQYANSTTLNDRTVFAVDALFDSADRIYEEQQTEEIPFNHKRILGIRFQAKGASGSGTTGHLDVYYSIDEGTTWTRVEKGLYNNNGSVWTDTCPLTSTLSWYEAHFDVSTQRIRFRFRNENSNSTFYLVSWVEMYEEQAWEA